MKTPIKELIDSVGNMAQGLDADELYDYFMEKATQMLEKEKEVIVNAYIDGLGLEPYEVYSKQQAKQYYNETFNTNKITREEKLETIVKLFAKSMFYGDWKWETPNERVITMLMQEVGMYPFKDEDDMISKTPVSDDLYKKAVKEVSPRRAKGWDESVSYKASEE